MNRKIFVSNVIFNIVSNTLILGILQFFIFPGLSNNNNADYFGQILSIYGIINIISVSIGSSLGIINIIYVKNNNHRINLYRLSINILRYYIIFCGFLFFIINGYTGYLSIITISLLTILRIFLTSFFESRQLYNLVFVSKFIYSVGLLIGLYLYSIVNQWEIIFIFSEVITIPIIYYILNSESLLTVESEKTSRFEKSEYEPAFIKLLVSKALITVVNYSDRLILPAFNNPSSVSIYYAASVLSKVIFLIVTPLNNVILSLLSNNKNLITNERKLVYSSLIITGAILLPLYFIINFLSEFLIPIFYPSLALESLNYVNLITFLTCIQVLYNIINNIVLINRKLEFQVVSDFIFASVYIPISILFTINMNLYGFIYASILANLIKLCLSLGYLFFVSSTDYQDLS